MKRSMNKTNKKCRIHNKELIYCKDCIETLSAINIIKVLRSNAKEQNKIYKEALKVLKKYETNKR